MPEWNVHFDLNVDFNNTQLIRLAERARALAEVIREIPIPPYLQTKLDALNIMRAVRGTTSIEGAELSEQEAMKIMASPKKQVLPQSRKKDEQEYRNAQAVMYRTVAVLKENPDRSVSEGLICELHKLLTQNIDYVHNTPGEYRRIAVRAGEYRAPQTYDEVSALMQRFVEWLGSPPCVNWDPIVRAIAAHFYLVSIHPFADGNGRTSRAIESFLLYKSNVNARGFYSLANYYYQNRHEYIRQLDDVRFNGRDDLTPFVMFALEGLVTELEEVHTTVLQEVKVISFRDYAREQFLQHGHLGTEAGLRTFQFLLSMGLDPMPVANVYREPFYRRVNKRTVQRDLKFLKDHRLIDIQSGKLRLNVEVMNQFTAPEALEREAIGEIDTRGEKMTTGSANVVTVSANVATGP